MNYIPKNIFLINKPLIGMIHLPAMPGYPTHPGKEQIMHKALRDLYVLEKSGFDGVLVENDNDQPHQIGVNGQIKEFFQEIMKVLVCKSSIPVGMEIIYDMTATTEIAIQVKADFIRLDVFADPVKTQWGIVPASIDHVKNILGKLKHKPFLLTDVHVKHAQLLEPVSLPSSIERSIEGGSDGIIVTGSWTGLEPDAKDLKIAKKWAERRPVIIGSGLNSENAGKLMKLADGAIVGTSIKTGEYVDPEKAGKLVKLIKSMQFT